MSASEAKGWSRAFQCLAGVSLVAIGWFGCQNRSTLVCDERIALVDMEVDRPMEFTVELQNNSYLTRRLVGTRAY